MSNKRLSERLEERLSKEVFFHITLAQLLVLVAIATYTIVFSYFSILKYMVFRAFGQDLGIYSQALWTTLHGRFFYETPDLFWNPNGSFFGVHFAPLMYLILPIYAVYSQPQTLLILQSFILGLAALPLYWLGRHELKSNTLALAVVIIYLLNPWMHAVNLYDFHLEAFLPAFFLFAFFFFLTHKWIKYSIFIFLAMITIDYASLLAIGFGLYWLIKYRKTITTKLTHWIFVLFKKPYKNETLKNEEESSKPFFMALITIITAILIFFIGLKIISVYGPEPLTAKLPWSNLGNTFNEIVLGLFNPFKVYSALSFDFSAKIFYVLSLFTLVAFLPILAPIELVMTLPWFVISLLSGYLPFYSLGWQYSANIVPFLFIATIYGIKRSKTMVKPRNFFKIFSSLLIAIIIISIVLTPLDPLMRLKIDGAAYNNTDISEHGALLESILEFIPANASILTINNIFPHVSNRANAYLWYPPSPPDYILYDVKSPDINDKIGNVTSAEIISEELSLAQYGIIASTDGIVLMEKWYTGGPIIFQPFTGEYNFSNLYVYKGETIHDLSSISKTVLLHPVTSPDDSSFWYGPYVTLSPGWYQATFRLMVNSTDVGYLMTLDATAQFGYKTLGEMQVYGHDFAEPLTWTNITMSFYVNQVQSGLEFRGIEVSNVTDVYLDLIGIQQIPKPIVETPVYFDFRELALSNGIMNNNLFIHSPQNESGTFWYGPYITIGPGVYNATFWLKVSSPQLKLLLNLDVTAYNGILKLASMNVTNSNFHGNWQAFSLIFQLNATTANIEFRGDVLKDESAIFFSNIELYKVG